MRENSLVQWLRNYPQPDSQYLPLGIGDDAAALKIWASDQELSVITTDLIADGAHFLAQECTPEQIGRKAMAVNLSDIAAMAAEPIAAFVTLLLPKGCEEAYTKSLMSAAIDLANEFGCVVAGGDTNNWNGAIAVGVLIVGKTGTRGPLLRSGARPGDKLLVTGQLGGSLAGHHFNFIPRINEALWLHKNFAINAGMDLSDGLAMDLRRLCVESGCGAKVHATALPISPAAQADSNEVAIERALGDGEDFELLLAVHADDVERILNHPDRDFEICEIGEVLPGDEILLIDSEGKAVPMPTLGFEHH